MAPGLVLLVALTACGKSDAPPDPAAPAPPTASPAKAPPTAPGVAPSARCNPVFADHRVEAVEAALKVSLDGEPLAVALDPAASYHQPPLVRDATHALCVGMQRTDPGDGGWIIPQIHAILHDDAGRAVMLLMTSPLGGAAKRPHVDILASDARSAESVMWQSGSARFEPDPIRCGAPLTLVLEGLRGTLGRGGERHVTLDGTLRFALPADLDDPALRETVAPLTNCEGGQRLDTVTSSDTARLPFAGACWSAGGSKRFDRWEMSFRARPASTRFDPFAPSPWTFNFVLPDHERLEAGVTLRVVAPDALVSPGQHTALAKDTAWVSVDTPLDGMRGPDWRATGGTITIARIATRSKPGSMFKLVDMEADFAIDLQHLGPCDAAPALAGAPIRVTGRVVVADEAD